jgi:hypothetical protein
LAAVLAGGGAVLQQAVLLVAAPAHGYIHITPRPADY